MSNWYTNDEGKHVPLNPGGQGGQYVEPQMQIQRVVMPPAPPQNKEFQKLKKDYPALVRALELVASDEEGEIDQDKALAAVQHLSDGQRTIVEQTLRGLQGKTVMQIATQYHAPESELKFVGKDNDAFQTFVVGDNAFAKVLKQRDSNFTLADSAISKYAGSEQL